MIRALVLGAIVTALLLTTAQARQVLPSKDPTCNLLVNEVRVSWPPYALSQRECLKMRNDLKHRDKTDADIQCSCAVGGLA